MQYEANQKHKPVPQPGRRGSICPPLADGIAQDLLDGSILHGSKRYATDGEALYCAQNHAGDRWHGYPVGFVEVTQTVIAALRDAGGIDRRALKRLRRQS